MIGGFAAIMVIGILLGSIGAHIPILKNIGGSAILCLFVPSALIGYKLLNPAIYNAIFAVMKTSNFLYLYIACLVTGSMLGMDRTVLVGISPHVRPCRPGNGCSHIGRRFIGHAVRLHRRTWLFLYCHADCRWRHRRGHFAALARLCRNSEGRQPALIASLIPAALIGNVIAIMSSGILKRLGDRYPQYSGNGVLVRPPAMMTCPKNRSSRRLICR